MKGWLLCLLGAHDWDRFGECRRDWKHVQRRAEDFIFGGPYSRIAMARHSAERRAGEELQAELLARFGVDVTLEMCKDAARSGWADSLRKQAARIAERRHVHSSDHQRGAPRC